MGWRRCRCRARSLRLSFLPYPSFPISLSPTLPPSLRLTCGSEVRWRSSTWCRTSGLSLTLPSLPKQVFICSVPPSGSKRRVGRHGTVPPVLIPPYVPDLTLTSGAQIPGHIGRFATKKSFVLFGQKPPSLPAPHPLWGSGAKRLSPPLDR